MTGTNFTLAGFKTWADADSDEDEKPYYSSLARGGMLRGMPLHMFTRQTIQDLLTTYWYIFPAGFEDAPVKQSLERCCGHPLFIVDGIFVPLYCAIRAAKHRIAPVTTGTANAAWLVSQLDGAYREMSAKWQDRIDNVLKGAKHLPTGTGQSTAALVPRVIQAMFSDDGHPRFDIRDLLAEAICSGIVAASASHQRAKTNKEDLDLAAEPLTHDALRDAVV